MAGSRLEKIGTIYTRVTGLLRAGAMKEEDKPLWYSIYEAFPPKYEPLYDRPAPNIPIQDIFYKEDILRAQFHKENKNLPAINLSDFQYKTQTQELLSIYQQLQKEGVPESQLYQSALEKLQEGNYSYRKPKEVSEEDKSSVTAAFKAAKEDPVGIKIKDIFKD